VIALPLPPVWERAASGGFLLAAVTMPVCCFLTAWKAGLRHLFPVPVLGVLTGVGALLGGWVLS
jgi:hypothetical protein